MPYARICEACGGSRELRTLNNGAGVHLLCYYCRYEREQRRNSRQALLRNEANRNKRKAIKSRGRFCQQCGRYLIVAVGHHLIPLRLGGSNEQSNLLLLCEDCHGLEHAMGTKAGGFINEQ